MSSSSMVRGYYTYFTSSIRLSHHPLSTQLLPFISCPQRRFPTWTNCLLTSYSLCSTDWQPILHLLFRMGWSWSCVLWPWQMIQVALIDKKDSPSDPGDHCPHSSDHRFQKTLYTKRRANQRIATGQRLKTFPWVPLCSRMKPSASPNSVRSYAHNTVSLQSSFFGYQFCMGYSEPELRLGKPSVITSHSLLD